MRPLDKSELEKLFELAKIKPRLRRDLKFSLHEIHDWEDRRRLAAILG